MLMILASQIVPVDFGRQKVSG